MTKSNRTWRCVLAFAAALFASCAFAQGPAPEQLEKLVGPIALYPDDLVGIILPSSTNPLQLVQADRYLEKRKADPKLAVDEKWDPAVKSLLNYPEVVKAMSSDLDWTTALGEAVVADQGGVLDAIQAFRRKSQSAGSLKSDAKQVVVVEKEVIKIVPADPQVIYVPQYNAATVVVPGAAPVAYAPAPYPVYYYPYPPGAALATGLVWGAAISSAWDGGHYVAHYDGNANININRNINVSQGNVNVNRPGAVATPRAAPATSQWKPNKQPGQVAGSAGARPATGRVGDTRVAAAQPRASTQPGTAFDGYGSRRQAQADSARGAGSRGSAASASPRASTRGTAAPAAARSGGRPVRGRR